MNKIYLIVSLLFLSISTYAQELKCNVVVNADRVDGSKSVFKTLEKSISEFVNQTNWTNKEYKKEERIECSMVLTIKKEDGKNYYGYIQIQSSRPVFNSIYTTPIFNHQDNNLNFSYIEFEPLRYNESVFQSDLVSIISFYANLILALDADSFEKYGGSPYYDKCQTIMSLVENQGDKPGWRADTNKVNRYKLIQELSDSSNQEYRKALYDYHIKGLDVMESNKKEGKNMIYDAIMGLNNIYRNNMTSYLLRVFMDAKADEIVQIFSDGPHVDNVNLVNMLNKISALNSNKWAEIK